MSLVAANLVVAAALAGLIWTIQLVHYPLFALVGAESFPRYEAEHQRRITWVVAPLMLANVGLGIAVFAADASLLSAINGALALGVFAATGLVYSRMHATLDPSGVARLVRANWARTAAWSAQVVVALALI